MKKLEDSIPTPLYIQLAELIKSDISNGKYLNGVRIPSENELMKTYQVSRVTVRKTMEYLLAEDLIIRRQGRGTFLNKTVLTQDINDFAGFYQALNSKIEKSHIKNIQYKFETNLDAQIREALGLSENQSVTKLVRQYLVDDSVLVLFQSYIPHSISKLWNEDEAKNINTLKLIRDKTGFTIENITLKIKASLVTKDFEDLIDLPEGSSLLELRRIAYSSNQKPVEYGIFSFCGDSYELTTKIII